MNSSVSSEIACIIIGKIGGVLSMIASFFILRDIALKRREYNNASNKNTFNSNSNGSMNTGRSEGSAISAISATNAIDALNSAKAASRGLTLTSSLMFWLSVGDFGGSFFIAFMSTWMVPKGTPGAYLAAGSVTSCTAQGFFGRLFYFMSIYCNVSLALAFCLIVRRGWTDEYTREPRVKAYFLVPPMLLSLQGLVYAIYDNAYNYNGFFFCDVEGYPYGCSHPHSEIKCTRGAYARLDLLIDSILLTVCYVVIVTSILLLVHSVYKQERAMDNYATYATAATTRTTMSTIATTDTIRKKKASRKNTIRTSKQGIKYIVAFGLAWLPLLISQFIKYTTGKNPKTLLFLMSFTLPTRGVWNFLVFFQPKYAADRARHGNDSRWSSIRRVLRLPEMRCNFFRKTQVQSNSQEENDIEECRQQHEQLDTPLMAHEQNSAEQT